MGADDDNDDNDDDDDDDDVVLPQGWTEDNEEKRRCTRCCSEISHDRRRSTPWKRHLPARRKTQFSRASISAEY